MKRDSKGRFVKGLKAWNKGTKGVCKAWNKGKSMIHSGSFKKGHKPIPLTNEGRKKIIKSSKRNKGKHFSVKTEFKKGTEHPNWKGGKSFEPYGIEFDEQLKEKIRKRDNCCCQKCFKPQEKSFTKTGKNRKLCVHHIDYNKKNNSPKNLIALCDSCHQQTNFKRNDWTNYFNKNKTCSTGWTLKNPIEGGN